MTAAIVLAGGVARRLGGVNKPALTDGSGRSSLSAVIAACRPARPVVVVGPDAAVRAALPTDADVLVTCESPAGAGPARAVAAGVSLLRSAGAAPGDVLLLAGDMPAAADAVAVLRAALARHGADGVVATVAGRRQWLLAVLRFAALTRACDGLMPGGRDESMRRLLGGLDLFDVEVPAASALDLDTWADVARAGFDAAD